MTEPKTWHLLTYLNKQLPFMKQLLSLSLALWAITPLPSPAMGKCDGIGDWQKLCACMWPDDEAGVMVQALRLTPDADWTLHLQSGQWEATPKWAKKKALKILSQCSSPKTQIVIEPYDCITADGTTTCRGEESFFDYPAREYGMVLFSSEAASQWWLPPQ